MYSLGTLDMMVLRFFVKQDITFYLSVLSYKFRHKRHDNAARYFNHCLY